jgi:hypothetical protein
MHEQDDVTSLGWRCSSAALFGALRASLDVFFRRAVIPVLAVAALVTLVLAVDQTHDLLVDVVGRIVVGAPENFGGSYQRVGLIAYFHLWIGTLLLALAAGLSLLALEPGDSPRPKERVSSASLGRAALLGLAVLGTIHFSLLQVGLRFLVLAGLSLAPWVLSAALARRGGGRQRPWLSAAVHAVALLLLVWIAVERAAGDYRFLPWTWGLRPQADMQSPTWNALTAPMLASALTPQLAGLALWFARRRLARLEVAHMRIALLAGAGVYTALVLVPWQPATILSMGSLAVVLAWLTWITCALSCVSLALRKLRLPPLLAGVVALVVVVSLYQEKIGLDEYAPHPEALVRDGETKPPPAPAPPEHPRALIAKLPGLQHSFVISADGGGLRAAVFTASVLAAADDLSCGEFGSRVSAASGVSGGSLGIATWIVLREEYVRREARKGQLPWSGCWALAEAGSTSDTPIAFNPPPDLSVLVQFTLLQDHLSMPLYGTLARDLLSPLGRRAGRGQYLLESWQDAARTVLAWQDPSGALPQAFATPLHAATGGLAQASLLAFNATDADSGALVTLSNAPTTPGGVDTSAMSIGAAALNSARFPLVSPAGAVRVGDTWRRVVDGGFFDNTGATALSALIARAGERIPADAKYLRINGNAPAPGNEERCALFWARAAAGPGTAARPASAPPPSGVPDFEGWSAARALGATRVAHGQSAVASLEARKARSSPLEIDAMPYFDDQCPSVFAAGVPASEAAMACHNRNAALCLAQDEARRVPLAWYLSQSSGFQIARFAWGAALRLLNDGVPRATAERRAVVDRQQRPAPPWER